MELVCINILSFDMDMLNVELSIDSKVHARLWLTKFHLMELKF